MNAWAKRLGGRSQHRAVWSNPRTNSGTPFGEGGARIRYHDLPSDNILSYVACTYSKSISTHRREKANIYLEMMIILIYEYLKEEERVIEGYH